MSAPSTSTFNIDDFLLVCLSCGDPFTPEGVADGNLPILFTCGHTVCVDCAKNVALALPGFDGKWACGWCKLGDGGAVNAGIVALVQSMATGVDLGPVLSRFQTDMEPVEEASAPLDISALTVEAGAAVARTLSELKRVNASRATMKAGFDASKTSFIAGVDSLLSAIIAHRDRVLGEAKQLFDAREKALAAQAEELTVKVSLLQQAVAVCKTAMVGGVDASPIVYESVKRSVQGLTRDPFGGLSVCPVVGMGIDMEAMMKSVEANVYVNRGVSAPDCELSGGGVNELREYNCLRLMCRNSRREAVPEVDGRDVSVRVVCAESFCVPLEGKARSSAPVYHARAMRSRAFFGSNDVVIRAEYMVEDESVTAVDVDVFVYGERVSRCPVRVPKSIIDSSAVLAGVARGTLEAFSVEMKSWFPDARKPELRLLFRMTRDGTKTSDFHSRCDGKGPTVVLIRSGNGFVFGGYADKSWHSRGEWITGLNSFVFTVSNPHGIPPRRYQAPDLALWGDAECGPRFGLEGIRVGSDGSLTSGCYTPLGEQYRPQLGRFETAYAGSDTFTGASDFTPAEIEVWQV